MPRVCPKCGRESPVESDFCPACGAPMDEHVLQGREKAAARAMADPPMKWHKFLTFFSLPASAVMALVNLIQAWKSLAGFDETLFVPEYISTVRFSMVLDVAVDALMLALGVATEYFLLKKRRMGVWLLMGMYVVETAYSAVMAALLVRVSADPVQAIGTAVAGIVMMALTWVYYRKRRHLFQ